MRHDRTVSESNTVELTARLTRALSSFRKYHVSGSQVEFELLYRSPIQRSVRHAGGNIS